MWVRSLLSLVCILVWTCGAEASAAMPGPLAHLQSRLDAATQRLPARVGIAIEDLSTGLVSGVNSNANMPAASTIKIPVMVEVFRQMSLGAIDLNRRVHVTASDKDYGWGDLCDARVGTAYPVSRLLWKMITESDNTATNMLIRLVGRQHINATMRDLGLLHTRVGDYIRSEGDIRSLRSSPADMVRLLGAMARSELVDPWSSRQMIAILEGQRHNSLLPAPLPREVRIAHKTGQLHDTLNDVGIVENNREPYIIAVMTTSLPALDLGRSFIRGVSRWTYQAMEELASWRQTNAMPVDQLTRPALAPSADVQRWLPSETTQEQP